LLDYFCPKWAAATTNAAPSRKLIIANIATTVKVLTEFAPRLRSERLRRAKLFANRSGRVANPFDCADQLVFSNSKMPRPISNLILMLDEDFATVRNDCFTDHF
jgi:hypothetical protein